MSLLTTQLPTEFFINNILPNLWGPDLANFARASKATAALVHCFDKRFGALADHEKKANISELAKKTHVINRTKVSSFDQYKHLNRFFKTLPFLPRFIAKYNFFRGESLRKIYLRVKPYFENQQTILKEFIDKPLNSTHPLQDLRDRCIRIERIGLERWFLEQEITSSQELQERFIEKLSETERRIFKVLSWFHSFFKPVFNVDILKFPDLITNPINFNEQKAIKFSETEITFKGEKIPVEIEARCGFNYDEHLFFFGKSIFKIKRMDNKVSLGEFCIERCWKDESGSLYREYPIKTVKSLKERHLHVDCFMDHLGRDTKTGDAPVARLMTQIVVEIFQRESENCLTIPCASCTGKPVLFAAGFFDGERKAYKKEMIEERTRGKLFPRESELATIGKIQLNKIEGPLPPNLNTRFIRRTSKNKPKPALVDFSLNPLSTCTWEEQIKKQPLLGPGTGPVLPLFHRRNLFQFENT